MVIDIPVIQDLALTASLGVAVLIFTNLILLPVLLSLRRREPARRGAQRSRPRARPGARRASIACSGVLATLHRAALGARRASSSRPCCSAAATWRAAQLKIGDLDPGAPELRADSRYNRDNAYITGHYALSSDTFAVIVKTAEGRLPQVPDPGRGRPPGLGAAAGARRADDACR